MLTNVLIINVLVKLCNKYLSPKLTQNLYFREFAATLPHIAQNAFVQGVLGAVAATRSVAANGIFDQNAAKKSLILMKNRWFLLFL